MFIKKNSFLLWSYEAILPELFSLSFIVLHLTVMFVNYLGLIFVYHVKRRSHLIFHMENPLS